MKDCCKNNNQASSKKSGFRKWVYYILYAIIALIVIGALIQQIGNN